MASVFVWGAPVLAVLVIAGLAGLVAVLFAPPAAWLVILLGGLWFYGGIEILRHRDPERASIPGLDLDRSDEPGLWALVERAAADLAVPTPHQLRITVEESVEIRRVGLRVDLVIGLPWLAASPEELRVAVVHSLARYKAGANSDRALLIGERLRRAREVVETWKLGAAWAPYLHAGDGLRHWMHESQAAAGDAACNAILGPRALDTLRRGSQKSAGFAGYWATSVGPCLADGFAPPLLGGWRELTTGRQDAGQPGVLVADDETLERRLLAAVFSGTGETLVNLDWARTADAIWLPRMRKAVADCGATESFTPASLATTIAVGPPDRIELDEWPDLVAAALILALVDDAGWTAYAPVEGPIEVHYEDVTLRPFGLCESIALADGSWDPQGWAQLAEEVGISELVVGWGSRTPPSTERVWPVETVAEPTADRRVEIEHSSRRGWSLTVVGLGALLGLPSGVALIWASSSAATGGGRIAMLGFGLAVLASLATWMSSRLRVLLPSGAIVITGDRVRIEHPGYLKKPFEIPRSAVRAIVIDDGDWSDRRRFPMGPTASALAFGREAADDMLWLWSDDDLGLVPILGDGHEIPNLAILVNDPALSPRVRRVILTGPIPGETLSGLLLRVNDAEAARAAFAPWGLTRAGTTADARLVGKAFLGAV